MPIFEAGSEHSCKVKLSLDPSQPIQEADFPVILRLVKVDTKRTARRMVQTCHLTQQFQDFEFKVKVPRPHKYPTYYDIIIGLTGCSILGYTYLAKRHWWRADQKLTVVPSS